MFELSKFDNLKKDPYEKMLLNVLFFGIQRKRKLHSAVYFIKLIKEGKIIGFERFVKN
jgi:hypothetical protein